MARTLIGTRIRERRRARRLTQAGLAKAAGISASYLNLIEHNKRGIAGRTLLAIARELGMQPAELSDEADGALITELLEVAGGLAEVDAEMNRVEEFVGRYPGWARLIGRLAEINRGQTERLRALSDRMAHDPYLAETMHQVLSNITAIRSTSEILAEPDDVPPAMQRRFLENLSKDSRRLSETAQAMVDFFERDSDDFAPLEPAAETLWPRAEEGQGSGLSPRFTALEQALPEVRFMAEARRTGFDPLRLADSFDAPVWDVLLRLAFLPDDAGFPRFGLIECDMSGAVILRKPTRALSPPQYSSACPLWPLYRAFARPRQVLRAVLDMPSGDRLLTYSVAYAEGRVGYDMPPVLRSVMVFSSEPEVFPAARDSTDPVLGGLHCSVCPRKRCPERRVDYILA